MRNGFELLGSAKRKRFVDTDVLERECSNFRIWMRFLNVQMRLVVQKFRIIFPPQCQVGKKWAQKAPCNGHVQGPWWKNIHVSIFCLFWDWTLTAWVTLMFFLIVQVVN